MSDERSRRGSSDSKRGDLMGDWICLALGFNRLRMGSAQVFCLKLKRKLNRGDRGVFSLLAIPLLSEHLANLVYISVMVRIG